MSANGNIGFYGIIPGITDKAKVVAVYDVEDKKLVLLFKAVTFCQRYFGLRDINKYVKDKLRHKSKVFEKRIICFRQANTEQILQLEDDTIVCFDKRYLRQMFAKTRFVDKS